MINDQRRFSACGARTHVLRSFVGLALVLLAALSPMKAQRGGLVDDITAQTQLIVTPTTLTFTVDMKNTSDTTYVFIPYLCWLFRCTPCGSFRSVGASTGFIVPWRLERPDRPTYKCSSRLAPSYYQEPFPRTMFNARFSPQLVAIRPGQHARFMWTKPYIEDPSYQEGSTCMIDTTDLPVRIINNDMRELFGDGLIEQTTPFREYMMDEVEINPIRMTQSAIRGETRATSFYLPYEQYDKEDRALFLSQRYIRVTPGPNTSCIVLEK